MDKNTGDKIKGLADAFLTITIIVLSVVALFFIAIAVRINGTDTIVSGIEIFIGILLFFVIVFIVWIIYVFIYSWGEMVNNVQQIKERLCDIPKQNNEQQEKELKENDNKNAVVYEIKEKPIEKWTCPNCGEQNNERAQNCINCFTKKP